MTTERGLDAANGQCGDKLFSQYVRGLEQFSLLKRTHEFHRLFPSSRLRCFPLGFRLGKMKGRRKKRFVTVHSLNAKITWLKHCRNLGHAKLTAARGQL